MLVLASNDITAFHVFGAVFAVFAVVVAGLGVMKHGFPSKTGEKVVIALAAVLMLSTVGSAIATSGEEEPKGSEHREEPTKGGGEGSEATENAPPAPDTAPESGQEGAGETGKPGKPGKAQPTAQTLQVSTDPGGELAFDKTELTGKPGTVKIVESNPSPVPHNIALEGPGVAEEGPVVPKGGTSQVEADLKAGSYTFYCSVPGHREAGMEGTLTVK